MKKVYESSIVIQKEMLTENIVDMWVQTPHIAENCIPGQFVSFYCKDKSKLLPRPISICDVDQTNHRVRFVYRIAGEGTKEFSEYSVFEPIRLMGPLGNGYLELSGEKVLLFGGGIGIPPMLYLAKCLKKSGRLAGVVLGYRDANSFLLEEFTALTERVLIASDDGSIGTRGTVLDAVKQSTIHFDMIAACGPMPMLKGIISFAKEKEVECFVSLEEKMACGVGACLGCICKTKEKDEHSKVNNKRICKEGPVFDAKEIEL